MTPELPDGVSRRSVLKSVAAGVGAASGAAGIVSADDREVSAGRLERIDSFMTQRFGSDAAKERISRYDDEMYAEMVSDGHIDPSDIESLASAVDRSGVSVHVLPVEGDLTTHLTSSVQLSDKELTVTYLVEEDKMFVTAEYGEEMYSYSSAGESSEVGTDSCWTGVDFRCYEYSSCEEDNTNQWQEYICCPGCRWEPTGRCCSQ